MSRSLPLGASLRVLRGILLVTVLFAFAAKLPDRTASGFLVQSQVRLVYGWDVGLIPALATVLAAELLVSGLLLVSPRRRGAALALCGLGFAFSLHHVTSALAGATGNCGCFGPTLSPPRWVPALLSGLLLLVAARDLSRFSRPLRLPSVAGAGAALAVPMVVGALAALPTVTSWLKEDVDTGLPTELTARDAYLFVFSPKCRSCLDAARNLADLPDGRRVIGVATPRLGSVDGFFRALGFTFPVEQVAPSLWYSLVATAPPTWLHVDTAGAVRVLQGLREIFEERPAAEVASRSDSR